MRSAIYRGAVVHTRLSPRRHRLRYSVFSMLFDLDELDDLDSDDSSSDSWTYLPHPSGGPEEVNAANESDSTNGEPTYFISWDIHEMDEDVTWLRMRVRCQYKDVAFNQWKGTTISSYRFRDS